MKHAALLGLSTVCALALAGCATSPQSPTAPSAAVGSNASANADGSTLKVTAPALISPVEDERTDTRKPTLAWANATGKYAGEGLAYELEVNDAAGAKVYGTIVGETPVFGTHTLPNDLAVDKSFAWRSRAVLSVDGTTLTGPWSQVGTFKTPAAAVAPTPTTPTGPSDGTVGPRRTIGLQEAIAIIVKIHDQGGYNLGGSSTRDYRIGFINSAVAAIYYGHSKWNSAGPDPNWCVKDAGGGRPQSDDVLVYCPTRQAWDLIGGSGGNGYFFHQDSLGVLPGEQNVYPPPQSALNNLPK